MSKANSTPQAAARILRKARRIKLLILDVDGVMTDGGIVINEQGKETKRFDVRDGQGIKLLQEAGIVVALLSGRSSKAVHYRARELKIRLVYQRAADKLAVYARLKKKTGFSDDEVAFVGDDSADLPLLRRVGFAVTVPDGWHGLQALVDYVTSHGGGRGAVREVADLLLNAQGKLA